MKNIGRILMLLMVAMMMAMLWGCDEQQPKQQPQPQPQVKIEKKPFQLITCAQAQATVMQLRKKGAAEFAGEVEKFKAEEKMRAQNALENINEQIREATNRGRAEIRWMIPYIGDYKYSQEYTYRESGGKESEEEKDIKFSLSSLTGSAKVVFNELIKAGYKIKAGGRLEEYDGGLIPTTYYPALIISWAPPEK